MEYADLSGQNRKLLERTALLEAIGRDPVKLNKRLSNRTGLEGGEIDTLQSGVTEGQMQTFLERKASTGAEGAALASKYNDELAKAGSLSDLEQFGTNAKADVADQLARESERLRSSLMASLGPDFGGGSAAAMGTLGRIEAGRRDELFRGIRGVDQSILQAREANRQTYDLGAISQALEQIGMIVEMRKLAREQKAMQIQGNWWRAAGLAVGAGQVVAGAMAGGAGGAGAGGAAGPSSGLSTGMPMTQGGYQYGSGGLQSGVGDEYSSGMNW